MAMMAAKRIFLDTNVLVYRSLSWSPFQSSAENAIQKFVNLGFELYISRQILKEYAAVVTNSTKTNGTITRDEALQAMCDLTNLCSVLEESSGVTDQWLLILKTHSISGRHVFDANLVALMLEYDVRHILTHNISDFKRYEPDITVSGII